MCRSVLLTATIVMTSIGIPPICGAIMMCLIGCVKDDPVDVDDNNDNQLEVALAKPAWIEGKSFSDIYSDTQTRTPSNIHFKRVGVE